MYVEYIELPLFFVPYTMVWFENDKTLIIWFQKSMSGNLSPDLEGEGARISK